MLPLLIMVVVVTFGLGAIAFVFWNEKRQEGLSHPEKEKADAGADQEETTAALLNRLGLEFSEGRRPQSEKDQRTPATSDQANLEEKGNNGTAGLQLNNMSAAPDEEDLKAESQIAIQNEELKTEIQALQAKYTQLEKLFQEKSTAFEKTEKALLNEQKIRKEFDSIKNTLEQQLLESKEKCKVLGTQLHAAKTEVHSSVNRIQDLEDNIKHLESMIKKKEQDVLDTQKEIEQETLKLTELEESMNKAEEDFKTKEEKISVVADKYDPQEKVKSENSDESLAPEEDGGHDTGTGDESASSDMPQENELEPETLSPKTALEDEEKGVESEPKTTPTEEQEDSSTELQSQESGEKPSVHLMPDIISDLHPKESAPPEKEQQTQIPPENASDHQTTNEDLNNGISENEAPPESKEESPADKNKNEEKKKEP